MSRAVAPSNVEELQGWLQEMVKQLAFTRLIAAVVALVARLRDLNTELTKQLAQLRRARPRSERLRTLEGQLLLPWVMISGPRNNGSAPASDAPAPGGGENNASKPKKSRKGTHPGRQSFSRDLERVPQYNGVPPRLRLCPQCGIEMGRLGHTQCEYLDVVPARVVVVQRTDETMKCKLDGTIVSAPPPPRIVERGVLGNRLIIEATADKFLEHLAPTAAASRHVSPGRQYPADEQRRPLPARGAAVRTPTTPPVRALPAMAAPLASRPPLVDGLRVSGAIERTLSHDLHGSARH